MNENNKFFGEIIKNFKNYFKKNYGQKFTNQTLESCISIYNLCKNENPDSVIEIGTNHGASLFALVKALRDLGKNLSHITTIDLDHEKWKISFDIQKELIKEYQLELNKVKLITRDFNDIDPENIIDPLKKIFVFYDMHDHEGPWSQKLLDLWIPLIKKGTIAVHDISPVNKDFQFGPNEINLRTKIQYKNGQYYAGFNECFRIIEWVNKNDIKIKNFNGGIYFTL